MTINKLGVYPLEYAKQLNILILFPRLITFSIHPPQWPTYIASPMRYVPGQWSTTIGWSRPTPTRLIRLISELWKWQKTGTLLLTDRRVEPVLWEGGYSACRDLGRRFLLCDILTASLDHSSRSPVFVGACSCHTPTRRTCWNVATCSRGEYLRSDGIASVVTSLLLLIILRS